MSEKKKLVVIPVSEKKKLIVNCDICDARNVRAENYSRYESIVINADYLLVNEKSKEVLGSLPVICNVDETVELGSGSDLQIEVMSCNGHYEISGEKPVKENTVLCVNGSLSILPGSEEALKNFLAIHVNGTARYPASISSSIRKLSVNGTAAPYPDDCILLAPEFTVDKYFPLRVRANARYYAESRVVLADPDVDVAPMVEKKVRFVTPRLLTTEERVADVIPLFDETAQFTVVPSGFHLLRGDITWSDALIAKYGSALYIDGNFSVSGDGAAGLEQLEKLIVSGTVFLPPRYQEQFGKIDAQYSELKLVKGRKLENKVSVTVDNRLLAGCVDGLHIRNCASVTIGEEVTAEDVLKLLKIENCAHVRCTPQQKGAVTLVCENVAVIKDEDDGEDLPGLEKLLGESMINADTHVL